MESKKGAQNRDSKNYIKEWHLKMMLKNCVTNLHPEMVFKKEGEKLR